MKKFLISDTITEFRTYEVEAESYEKAAELVDQHATDDPEALTGGLVLGDRGITDRFQQDETKYHRDTPVSNKPGETRRYCPICGIQAMTDEHKYDTCKTCGILYIDHGDKTDAQLVDGHEFAN
jgi:hypothetical protein